ncbi:hypothetical protein KIN20_007734 [Parelaphostrongylus tenuis]|uniref:Uncharacterized protein n=1 Tax=Parelaphostrongylus tenuis TaxID=148309 RepID=A0AAD5MMQ4_PARTN|nr:hypothetical protein KIN20_007734 [Parelaphostrongylus tenuis]
MRRFPTDSFIISLLATLSTVLGCGVTPAGQALKHRHDELVKDDVVGYSEQSDSNDSIGYVWIEFLQATATVGGT